MAIGLMAGGTVVLAAPISEGAIAASNPASGKFASALISPVAPGAIQGIDRQPSSVASVFPAATSFTKDSSLKQQRSQPAPASPARTTPAPIAPTPQDPRCLSLSRDDLRCDPQDTGDLDLPPSLIEDSPVLRRWLREIPNVQEDIRTDPAFRTRARFGYSYFPSADGASGIHFGIEDVFVGRTGLTVSGEYQRTFRGSASEVRRSGPDSSQRYRETFGGDLRYYVFPLGSIANAAPVLGYRHIETNTYTTEGVNIGLRVVLNLSRTGAADLALTQSWVSPGSNEEVGITTLSFGYAVTRRLRLSTDFQRQNAPQGKDSRLGIALELML